jgi:hypothetical protein
MRIRSKILDRLCGSFGAAVLRAWRRTLDVRTLSPLASADVNHPDHAGDYIYVAWHETILAMTLWGMPVLSKAVVLISQHQDGEYISQIVEHLGASTIRGSTKRGGRAALRELLQLGPNKHLGITPDGPRGPRRQFQAGAAYVASRIGRPIVPVGCGYSSAWRARSWDRFAVPKPFSALRVVVGSPVNVPAGLDSAGIEIWRSHLEKQLLECTAAAEWWAANGHPPGAQSRGAA